MSTGFVFTKGVKNFYIKQIIYYFIYTHVINILSVIINIMKSVKDQIKGK